MKGKFGAESQYIDYWHRRWFGLPLPDVKIYFKTVMMKTIWEWHKTKETNGKEQENKKLRSRYTYIYMHMWYT